MKLHKHMNPIDRFWARVKKTPNCWLWTGAKNSKGYGDIMVDKKHIKAHRYSYILHKGNIPINKCVCHSCDTPLCVNPSHLWVGSNAENVRDRVIKGREADRSGENNPNSKLSKKDVEVIVRLYNSGLYKVKDIALQYLINRNHVTRLVKKMKSL